MTPLDQAHALMQQNPDDASHRLRFYERLAECELFLLLECEVEGDAIKPLVFPLEESQTVLVFDREDRLVEFTGKITPYVAMSGRKLVEMLQGQGLALGVNLGVAPSSILIPQGGVDWLAETLLNRATGVDVRIEEFTAPTGFDPGFLRSLDAKLSAAATLARAAYLVGVTYEGGDKGALLGFVGAVDGAETALKQAVTELVSFSGSARSLDIAFFDPDDPVCARLERVGLKFDLPDEATGIETLTPAAPGMDPDNPPRLK